MMTRNFGMGFFGRMPFGMDARTNAMHHAFTEKWSKMTDTEKLELMNQRMEAMNDGRFGKGEFTVADIDRRCEEWMKKTPKEKDAFIKERKEMMSGRERGDFWGHKRGFRFDCREEKEAEAK